MLHVNPDFLSSTTSCDAVKVIYLALIYGAIVDWWGRRANLSDDVSVKAPALVAATLEIYNTIKKAGLSKACPPVLRVE
jgi:hypothetical protein